MEYKKLFKNDRNLLPTLVLALVFMSGIVLASNVPSEPKTKTNECMGALRSFGSKPAFVKDLATGEWRVNMEPMKYGADGKPQGRGFISAFPMDSEIANDATVKSFLAKEDIEKWALRLLIVPDLKTAEEELLHTPYSYKTGGFDDTMMPVIYIAGSEYEKIRKSSVDMGMSQDESEIKFNENREFHREIFSKMVSPIFSKNGSEESRLFYVSHVELSDQGKPRLTYSRLPIHEVRRLNFETGRLHVLAESGRPKVIFLFRGWVKLPVKGVVRLDDYFANKDRVREIERQARKFFKEGIIGSITFNSSEKAMEDVIAAVRDMDRKGQSKGGGLAAHQRFNPGMIEKFKNGLKDYTTYSVEVRDPQGRVIGGTFGQIYEGIFDGISVAYPRLLKWKKDAHGNLILQDGLPVPLYEIDKSTGEAKLDEDGNPVQSFYGIEIARIAKYFLFKKMQAAGFILQDAHMVTEFTKGIGGAYISVEEFEEIKRQSKALGLNGSKVDWSPIKSMPEPRKAEGSRK